MGGVVGLNATHTDANGRYSLPPPRHGVKNAPSEVPVSFRCDGYKPLTRIAKNKDAVLDVSLEDGKAFEWMVPLCKDVRRAKPLCGEASSARAHLTVGFEMVFTLPCNAEEPRTYGDVDYSGNIVSYREGLKTYYLRTMWGGNASSGLPLSVRYLSSETFSERAWLITLDQRRIDGLDARGVSKNGTYWRWVGPLLGEFAEYEGVNLEASKYFDALLDGICFQPKF